MNCRILLVTLLCVAAVAGCGGGSGLRVGKFAGVWGGHDRGLSITRNGRGAETIDSGCCSRAVILHFRITRVWGTRERPSARVAVTYVHVYKGRWFSKEFRPPHVGEVGTLRIVKGVLHEPLGNGSGPYGDTYCNGQTAKLNHVVAPCGA